MKDKQAPVVSKAEPNLPALQSGWGEAPTIDPSDVLIPKILLMQPISELVTEEKAKAGSIVRSTTKEVIAEGRGKGMAFIPLMTFKTWIIFEKEDSKFEFRRTEPFTPENSHLEWEWVEKGTTWQRNQAINCYALLPSDVLKEQAALEKLEKSGELPDVSQALLPVLLQFTRTSLRVGKEVVTHFAQSQAFNVPPARTTLILDTEKTENDKGTFYLWKLGRQGATPDIQLAAAKKWYGIVAKSAMRVDDRDLQKGAEPDLSVTATATVKGGAGGRAF